MARVLIVEDEINVLKITQLMLTREGHDVSGFSTGNEAISNIEAAGMERHKLNYDVVLTDYRLGDVTGLEVLKAVKRADPSTQVILVTAYATTQAAVDAMREGAYDYIEKPFKREELLALVAKAAQRRFMLNGEVKEKTVSVPKPKPRTELPGFIGNSEAMNEVMDLVRRVAPTRANILITGESGTGKEVIARIIHNLSGSQGPFVPVNCGAIPETLVESEFFGYTKGAFTGATRDKVGFFQAASGGAIFLDEIGELPIAMQVKLLRAIQEKKIQPVGSTQEIPVNVRIIAATNRDLRAEVDAHRFREDLFFRLNVIQLSLPPLRERQNDLITLIDYFLKKFNEELGKSITGVEPEVMSMLRTYDYRGNVRELENIMEHAVTLEIGPKITVSSLPAYLRNGFREGKFEKPKQSNAESSVLPIKRTRKHSQEIQNVTDENTAKLDNGDIIELESVVEDLERTLMTQAMEKSNGSKTEAARLLGISFRSLRYRLKKYNME